MKHARTRAAVAIDCNRRGNVDIVNLFRGKAQQLYWRRLDDERVYLGSPGTTIENDNHYFVIRLKEMYLRHTRQLWRKFYPMLHCYVQYGDRDEHTVAGPGQLTELGNANLDRLISLNQRLAGPIPYRGGDVTMLSGLYSVPGQDLAGMLIHNLSALASLTGGALGQAAVITTLVKSSIDGILGMDQTALRLGVHDTFYSQNPLRAGYYVGVAAVAVDRDQLWLKEGRLVKGATPLVARPFEDADYMVIEVEARNRREDWPRLPGLEEINERLATVMRDNSLTVDAKEARLHDLWPVVTAALRDSPFLTRRDAELIAGDVEIDLTERLKSLRSGNPFERRSWGEGVSEQRPPTEFDLVDVADYLDSDKPADVARAHASMSGNPFQTGR